MDPIRFTPDHYRDAPTARRYDLRGLTYRERTGLDAEVTARWGREATFSEITDATRDGIAACFVTEDERQRAHATLDAYEAAVAAYRDVATTVPVATNGAAPPELKDAVTTLTAAAVKLEQLQRDVSRAHPPLASKLSTNEAREGERMFLLVQRGLCGWTNVGRAVEGVWRPYPCTRERDRLTDDCMSLIPDADLFPIAQKVLALSTLTEADRGNSASPSGVSDAPASLDVA